MIVDGLFGQSICQLFRFIQVNVLYGDCIEKLAAKMWNQVCAEDLLFSCHLAWLVVGYYILSHEFVREDGEK